MTDLAFLVASLKTLVKRSFRFEGTDGNGVARARAVAQARGRTELVLPMIRYTQGNLLEAEAEAVVNTVNEVGVMGKGIALQFKDAFPASARAYMEAAKRGEVRVGRVFVTRGEELLGPRWILHFPTKRHWRHGSKLEWVTEGLVDLVRVLREKGIRSVALPPLGCGNGGLDWERVRAEIERAFAQVDDVEALVYGPSAGYS